MKKIIIYFILLLLFGFASSFAQAAKSKTTENAQQTKSLEDPKLSPEEQALRLTAGANNPAKIDESAQVDPKTDPKSLPTEEDYGISNAKPAEGQDIDPKREALKAPQKRQAEPDPAVRYISGSNQPAGEDGGVIPDYRNMQAGGNDQPAGAQPESIPNYREMQGSGDQPPGDPPNK
jgi:hypothetical protein